MKVIKYIVILFLIFIFVFFGSAHYLQKNKINYLKNNTNLANSLRASKSEDDQIHLALLPQRSLENSNNTLKAVIKGNPHNTIALEGLLKNCIKKGSNCENNDFSKYYALLEKSAPLSAEILMWKSSYLIRNEEYDAALITLESLTQEHFFKDSYSEHFELIQRSLQNHKSVTQKLISNVLDSSYDLAKLAASDNAYSDAMSNTCENDIDTFDKKARWLQACYQLGLLMENANTFHHQLNGIKIQKPYLSSQNKMDALKALIEKENNLKNMLKIYRSNIFTWDQKKYHSNRAIHGEIEAHRLATDKIPAQVHIK